MGLGEMERNVGRRNDRSRYRTPLQETPTEDAGHPLGHRTACAICRRVLLPVFPAPLASASRAERFLDGEPCGVGYEPGEQCAHPIDYIIDPWGISLLPVPSLATRARRYPAARAWQLAPRGYAVGHARGRWTGWVCASCTERLTVEEHRTGAQRALARRVASLEQRLRLPASLPCSQLQPRSSRRSPRPPMPIISPTAPWSARRRGGGASHTSQWHFPLVVSLDEYRAVRRDLRACRRSLAELTATLASVADDPVLAWPPLY